MSLPPGIRRNVAEVRDVLADPLIGAIDPENCDVVFSDNGDEVLDRVAGAAAEDGPLIVYWTGHGALTDGELFLADRNSDGTDLGTWISALDVADRMASPSPGHADRLLILDVCFSSGPKPGQVRPRGIRRALDRLAREGIAVLSAVGTSALGYAVNTYSTSVFTSHLVTLLRAGMDSGERALHLGSLHRQLASMLRSGGYHGACLRNAAGYRPSLVLNRALNEQESTYLPARLAAVSLRRESTQRHALALGLAAPDPGPGPGPGTTPGSAPGPGPAAGVTAPGRGFKPVRPSDDAGTFYNALLRSGCGFSRSSTRLLQEPGSWEDVRDNLRTVVDESDNMLLVYIAAHGVARMGDGGLDLLLTLSPGATVPLSEVVGELSRSLAESVTLMVDLCRTDAAEQTTGQGRAAGGSGGFPQWRRRSGLSCLDITWRNSAGGLPVTAPDAVALSGEPHLAMLSAPRRSGLFLNSPLAGGRVAAASRLWAFSSPGRQVYALDRSGPLSPWSALLQLTAPEILSRGPLAERALDWSRTEQSPPTPSAPEFSRLPSPPERPSPSAPASGAAESRPPDAEPPSDVEHPSGTEQPPGADQPEETEQPADADSASGAGAGTPSDGGTPSGTRRPPGANRPRKRGHRARLRVPDGALPTRPGAAITLTFLLQPLDEPWEPDPATDATDERPLDITVRMDASSAEVSPSLMHLRLTDARGTAPGDFRITPTSAEPVKLFIDVLRRADGAVIQELTAELPALDTEDLEPSR
ncbi:hypothetical protein AB0O64_11430 [Streptomyces sp. NPDC088341]|uniref:hypothetical protein n=1 Tax=Streptomyces sp. NPDC088341 TaxID=3154870 RepID=UPI00343F80AA